MCLSQYDVFAYVCMIRIRQHEAAEAEEIVVLYIRIGQAHIICCGVSHTRTEAEVKEKLKSSSISFYIVVFFCYPSIRTQRNSILIFLQ